MSDCVYLATASLDGYLLPPGDAPPDVGAVLLGRHSYVALLRSGGITSAAAWQEARGAVPHWVAAERGPWVPPGSPVRWVTGPVASWWEQVVASAGGDRLAVLAGDTVATDLLSEGHVDRTRVRVEPVLLGGGTPALAVPHRLELRLERAEQDGGAVVLEHRVVRTRARSGAASPGGAEEPGPATDVAAFVLARVAEDEQVARAASGERWVPAVAREPGGGWTDVSGWLVTLPDERRDGPGPTVATAGQAADQAHLVRWDPGRVLAECALRRRLVRRFADVEPQVVAELATLWSEHPGYRPEWRPRH